jgi:hypothetical protein
MSESRYFFKISYLTLKEDILCQKEDGRIWPKKEDMSSQRRTYDNPNIINPFNSKSPTSSMTILSIIKKWLGAGKGSRTRML